MKIERLSRLFSSPKGLSILFLTAFMLIGNPASNAETITFSDSWGQNGFNLTESGNSGVEIIFSIPQMELFEIEIDGAMMHAVGIPGVILPNNAGAPNLPGTGRYIALPEGAAAEFQIVDYRTEVFYNIDLAPAPVIPRGNDDSPLKYSKDPAIYQTNAYYPAEPVMMSETMQLRGVDAVIVGVTPFQYNPVTKELIVYRDLKVRVDFAGGNGHFGEDALRSRWWEPILQQHLINYSSLPQVNLNRVKPNNTDEDNVEYIIIVPDDPVFIAWADTIKQWRNEQGIITGITTLSEIGGNNATLIENYINNAYHNWEIRPVAVLLLSDYQNTGDLYGITSPIWNGYCVSDNIYADIDGDDLPELNLARITAQNGQQLAFMINKMLTYEREPYTDPNFYEYPLIAGGWQSDRWFILCCEVIYGFMENVLDKRPVRQYAGTSGPPSSWSSNPNTYMIIAYFGPSGLGYIPASPSYLTNWSGNATGINNAINSGAFIVQHRDHGMETGWGTPYYTNSNLSGLTNDMYPFVFSINCLTGKYNWSSQCFTEAFHRMNHGALGVIAASDISYSFVNDTYVWGMYDSMWPEFDPYYGGEPTPATNLQPGFANSYGKLYLEASSWPYNPGNKDETYHLFHHHGDAFITMYSEVPQNLMVVHNDALLGGMNSFTVTADDGSLIALTVDGAIIGTAAGIGTPVSIGISPQNPGDVMLVTVTKANYYRYMADVQVIPPSGPYVIAGECEVSDAAGWNPNGQLDYDETSLLTLTMENIGIEDAIDVDVWISTDDPLLTIIDDHANFGTVAAGGTVTVPNGYAVSASPDIPDGHVFVIDVEAVSGTTTWQSNFVITGHAPELVLDHLEFSDPTGNNNGWLDPGETADVEVFLINEGSAPCISADGVLLSLDPYITVNTSTGAFGDIVAGAIVSAVFNVTADANTPQEYLAAMQLDYDAEHDFSGIIGFDIMVGNILYDPTGPDAYGYLAYDPFDIPENPVYDWTEISADSGGPGTLIPFTLDDQTFQYELPFNFRYYGVDYDTFSVGCNGWISMGVNTVDDYNNSGIPDIDGPTAMIAPYWEDLSPQRPNSGKVWRWYDSVDHRLILEWNHIEQYAPTGSFETFQVILLDPAHYPTGTGDGKIMFQYKDMSITVQSEGTVGIENHLSNDGIQILFDGAYDIHIHHIENGMVYLFTTGDTGAQMEVTLTPVGAPIVIPAAGGTFEYGLNITNIGAIPAVFDGWTEAVLPNGSTYGPILLRTGLNLSAGASISRNMTQYVPPGAPAGDYIYRCNTGYHPTTVLASDEFPFTKSGTDASAGSNQVWEITGWDLENISVTAVPEEYYLAQNTPNPFNPETEITLGLPEAAKVELVVFNLLGQRIAVLHDGYLTAGKYTFTFNAGDMSSGVYFYMLKSDNFTQVKKMVLLR